jgi:ABC-2 type transport system permease protein
VVTLILSELSLRRTSLLVWAVSVAGLVVLIAAFYPQVRNDPSLNALYGNLSASMQALLGGSDLTSPVGYLNTQLFAFVLPTVLLVFGLGRGAASIAGEEEDRTLDLLLAQPLSRTTAYTAKAVALAVGLVTLGAVTFLPLFGLNSPAGFDLPVANLVAACGQMTLMCLALALAAQAIAAWTGRRAVGLAAVAGYTLVTYVLYGLSGTVTWLVYLRPLTIWRWYLPNDPLAEGFQWTDTIVLLTVCVAATVVGSVLFARRDLRA